MGAALDVLCIFDALRTEGETALALRQVGGVIDLKGRGRSERGREREEKRSETGGDRG